MTGIWRYIRRDGEQFNSIGVRTDGTLFNPNGYPEPVVRDVITWAEDRLKERRSRAAIKAGVTRAKRQELRVHRMAEKLLADERIPPTHYCYCCRRKLVDQESIDRSVGPECWDRVLLKMTAIAEAAPRNKPPADGAADRFPLRLSARVVPENNNDHGN